MTVIEIRPHPWGWKVFEAPGVEPVFSEKNHAINNAQLPRLLGKLGGKKAAAAYWGHKPADW